MMLVEMTAPAIEALPVAGLRDHLRLGTGFEMAEDTTENTALAGFLRAAIATIEGRTGKVLLTRQYRMQLAGWRDGAGQPLPLAPVSSIERVELIDADGDAHLVEPGAYRLLADMQRPMLMPIGSLLPQPAADGAVSIVFSAGFGPYWDSLPADLAQAVLLLAARYHEDRSYEGSPAAMPFGVSALIERWRSVRVLGGRGNTRGRA